MTQKSFTSGQTVFALTGDRKHPDTWQLVRGECAGKWEMGITVEYPKGVFTKACGGWFPTEKEAWDNWKDRVQETVTHLELTIHALQDEVELIRAALRGIS